MRIQQQNVDIAQWPMVSRFEVSRLKSRCIIRMHLRESSIMSSRVCRKYNDVSCIFLLNLYRF